MAYDGIVVSSIINEIKDSCLGGRVLKVQQPSSEVITLTIKGLKGQSKIFISSNATLPIVYMADTLPAAPMQAPAFCMLLRKHLGNGRLTDIRQPGFDRIFDFVFEHMDEMGDITERHLLIEIMGRQSNIILTDNEMVILDSIKRIMPDLGEVTDDKAVRIIYPGRKYELPDSQGKLNPVESFNRNVFDDIMLTKTGPISKVIFSSLTGFSKSIAEEIVFRSGLDGRMTPSDLSDEQKDRLYDCISNIIEGVKSSEYDPCIVYVDGMPKDYHAFRLSCYDDIRSYSNDNNDFIEADSTDAEHTKDSERVNKMSQLLIRFYADKEKGINLKSRSQDIKKVLTSSIERASRKYDLQLKQLKDTEDRDTYRIYGELLNTYGYSLKGGEDHLTCDNYYDNTEITIPLDPQKSSLENAQKYFKVYNKKKRTWEALQDFVKKTKEELDYLLSLKTFLDMAESEEDVNELRREMQQSGIIKKSKNEKGARKIAASKPLHYVSSDGYDIYVGKNNIQNDQLSFEIATGKDLWFHAKNAPGSHVIVKLKPDDRELTDVPDRVFEEAASIAAFYSSQRNAPKVEIDYTQRKQLKRPPGANAGYVIYHTNYSMMAEPVLPSGIENNI